MDAFPVEIIGNILSWVADARSVAIASTICRKWRDAAKHYVHRLRFDLPQKESYCMDRSETQITELVMRTTRLQDLLIYAGEGVPCFSTASVMAWLLHTKGTLTHLTFFARIKSRTNLLEKLATGGNSTLKCLECKLECLDGIDPFIHNLPSLVSLTLDCLCRQVPMRHFEPLFLVCQKLESLTLAHVVTIREQSEFHIPPSLRSLRLESVVIYGPHASVNLQNALNLESLSLHQVSVEKIELGNMENLRCLELVDCVNVAQLEVEILPSLLHLTIVGSSRRLFSPIISKAGMMLSTLKLHFSDSHEDQNDLVDVTMIASSFPRLWSLSLDYEHAYTCLAKLEQVVVLELCTNMKNTNHEAFARWIVRILESCPNAKQLTIMLGDLTLMKTIENQRFASRLVSLLISLLRPYADIDIKIQM